MTLRTRGQLLLLAVVTAFALLGVIVFQVVSWSNDINRSSDAVLLPAAVDVSAVALATSDQERALWGYALSGNPELLTTYRIGANRAAEGFSNLEELLTDEHSDLLPLVMTAKTDWQLWTTDHAEPRIAEVGRGEPELAQEQINSGEGRRAVSLLRSDLALLALQIDARLAAAVDDVAEISRGLSLALLATALLTVVVVAGAVTALLLWVLKPLRQLRDQMRRLAREHDIVTPLVPSGPPEISAVGRDTELLRQSLVGLLDDATAATEGLAQEGPTVNEIRALLRGPDDPVIPGYGISSATLSAQGSVTGDWWDVFAVGTRMAMELGDVSGHDAAAGVVATRFKASLHAGLQGGSAPGQAVAQAAAVFATTPGRFASYVLVQFEAGQLHHLNAGHHPPVVVRSDGSVAALAATGPLVTTLGGTWETLTTDMAQGDVVAMYTDGLVEGRDDGGEEIGEAQVERWCAELAAESSSEPANVRSRYIAHGLLGRARRVSVDLRRDDVAVVVAVAS